MIYIRSFCELILSLNRRSSDCQFNFETVSGSILIWTNLPELLRKLRADSLELIYECLVALADFLLHYLKSSRKCQISLLHILLS